MMFNVHLIHDTSKDQESVLVVQATAYFSMAPEMLLEGVPAPKACSSGWSLIVS